MLKIFCDGGSRGNPGFAASAFVAYDEKDQIVAQKGKFLGETTNNVAEYSAVILALSWLLEQTKKDKVNFFLDSQLIINQLSGVFKIKDKTLITLAAKVKFLEKQNDCVATYKYIPRIENKIADLLVNQTLDNNQKNLFHK